MLLDQMISINLFGLNLPNSWNACTDIDPQISLLNFLLNLEPP